MSRITSHVVATLFAVAILVLSGAALLLNSAAILPASTPVADTEAGVTTPIPSTLTLTPASAETTPVVSPSPFPSFTASATPVLYTETPQPVIDYPAPSDEWLDYYDPNFGINFKYPSNWFAGFTGSEVAITNFPRNVYVKGADANPNATRINITLRNDLGPNESLDGYIAANEDTSTFISTAPIFTLENGIQISRMIVDKAGIDIDFNIAYLTNGKKVLRAATELGDTYSYIQDELVKTISIALPQTEGTATPMPTIQIGHFLPPSDEWVSYTHPTLNYGFAYPSNWFIESEPGSDTIYLHNVSPGMIKSTSDSNYIKIIITHQKSGLAGYTSLEDYLADPKYAATPEELLAPQQFETLENGYQIARQHRAVFMSNGGVLVIYLTDGKNLYALAAFDVKSRYLNVVDRILKSWVMPGTAIETPSPQAGESPFVTPFANSEAVTMGEFLAPADDWVTYIDATYGYSFDYPANFLVVPASKTGYQTDIFNRSNDGFWYNPADFQNFHVGIIVFEDKTADSDLESYVHSRHKFDTLAISIVEESWIELAKGYSGFKQILKSVKGRIETRVFIEHSGKVYVIIFVKSNSAYIDTFEKLLGTLKLPET
jgi:hypothetical protein